MKKDSDPTRRSLRSHFPSPIEIPSGINCKNKTISNIENNLLNLASMWNYAGYEIYNTFHIYNLSNTATKRELPSSK